MLEEEAMNKKAQEEKIKQEQAENDAFFLEFELGYIVIVSLAVLLIGLGGLEFSEFVHDPQHVCSQYQLPLSAILRSHSRQLRKNLAIRRSGYIVIVSLGGLEFSEFVHDPQHVCSQYQYQLPLSAILRSHSRQLRENLAIRRLGALCPRSDVSDVGLPSEKVMTSGKNGDDGDLLLFRDGPDACDISTGTLRLASQVFSEWNVPWRLPVPGSYQFKDSCAVRDDLRKAYEKCNDLSQESRALICTLLKESSKKDHKLHLSVYGKAAQLERQMETKSAWFQEKYSGRTPGGIGCSSSQTDFPLTEKSYHQTPSDEEALKKFVFVVVVSCYLASVSQEEDHQYIIAVLGLIVPLIIVAIGVEISNAVSVSAYPYLQMKRSRSRQLRGNPVIRRSGALYLRCLCEECQSLLPEKVMAYGKNGDDGDLLLFRDGPGAYDISAGALRLASQFFLEWNVPWRLLVLESTLLESD
ncbi:hypothetical protein Tco_0739125 [Tanacetum coccineum]